MPDTRAQVPAEPSPALIRRWQRHLANERLEERVYRKLAARKEGEEREILLAIADAERRHQQHWIELLGPHAEHRRRPDLGTLILSMLGSIFGSVFVLALIQQQETTSPYETDQFATDQMAADEKVHAEVVRALAAKSRARLSGNFRAAVFGTNDGLVSNLALVLGVGAAGMSNPVILLTGISGLLAGALSMGAGEYISVRSQRELLEASRPVRQPAEALTALDFDANELSLVYRARGHDPETALAKARRTLARAHGGTLPSHTAPVAGDAEHEELGTGLGAAASSFCFFASGAVVPILPYIFGMSGMPAILTAAGLVGLVLLGTGGTVGVLSGRPPLPRALRQLAIGFGAATATYLLGLLFGTSVG